MKKTSLYFTILLIFTILLSSFKKTKINLQDPPTEFQKLVTYLETNGNFVNTQIPSLINAEELEENLNNKKYLVLDLRSETWYEYGHVQNAVNVKGNELLSYFENKIDPAKFDKITLICYSGQSASYYTALLRIYGFNNVYALKWGMSSWYEDFAENYWVKNAKDQLESHLETTPNAMAKKGSTPTLNTGKTEAKEILKERIKAAFNKPYKEFINKPQDVLPTAENFYIVNYADKARYNYKHIKGAIHYAPKTFSITQNLLTLPTDKKVIVSCDTGLAAAQVVAYLYVLGYDVGNLAYGANGYMNSEMIQKGWNGFSEDEIKNYDFEEEEEEDDNNDDY